MQTISLSCFQRRPTLSRNNDIERQLRFFNHCWSQTLVIQKHCFFARAQAGEGKLADAVETLDAVADNDPKAGFAALGQSADWLIQMERYDEAEQRLRRLLAVRDDIAMAHRRLAQLLNNQGRRIEAAIPMRKLASLGDITETELYGLNTFSDPFIHRATLDAQESIDATTVSDIKISQLTQAKMRWYAGRLRDAKLLVDRLVLETPD